MQMWAIKVLLGLAASVSLAVHAASHFDPVTSMDNEYTDTKTWVVDPFIIPPNGNPDREAIGKPGDFSEYPEIDADAGDRIKFIQRPIVSGSQIHGVYVVTDETAVADGACPSTAGSPCQPLTDGTNATECTGYKYGLPLVPMEGDGGFVYYTTDELGTVASQYGVDHGENAKAVMFACPWGGHCADGMKVKVVVHQSNGDHSGVLAINPHSLLGLIALSIYLYQLMA